MKSCDKSLAEKSVCTFYFCGSCTAFRLGMKCKYEKEVEEKKDNGTRIP